MTSGADDLPFRPCAGVVLVNADGRVFAGQRIDHASGAWQMPQGGEGGGRSATARYARNLDYSCGATADKPFRISTA